MCGRHLCCSSGTPEHMVKFSIRVHHCDSPTPHLHPQKGVPVVGGGQLQSDTVTCTVNLLFVYILCCPEETVHQQLVGCLIAYLNVCLVERSVGCLFGGLLH